MRIAVAIVFMLVCVALTAIVLMQEGKSAGLGAIQGAADTYWGKNKGRSMEGAMIIGTRVLAIAFVVLSVLLNTKLF
ncbi:preprotein translocase subunit SecG [Lachnospiraceae bacterium KH1T2]|nr:preprotein translocase subunit SecG [Lachnospiraceae bacterium KH1T2]